MYKSITSRQDVIKTLVDVKLPRSPDRTLLHRGAFQTYRYMATHTTNKSLFLGENNGAHGASRVTVDI